MELKYEDIMPLIVKESISGTMIVCEFKAPNSTNVILSAVGALEFQNAKSKVLTTAKTEAKSVFSNLVRNFLQRIVGYSAGSSAGRVLDQGLNFQQRDIFLTNEEKKKAVMKAFEMVAKQFEIKDGTWHAVPR